MCDKGLSALYSAAPHYGKDFMLGLSKVLGDDKTVDSTFEGAFFLHSVAFVLDHAGRQM